MISVLSLELVKTYAYAKTYAMMNAFFHLSMRCVVFELAGGGGGTYVPPPAVRRWLRPPAVRGLIYIIPRTHKNGGRVPPVPPVAEPLLHVKYHSVKSSGALSRTLERLDRKVFFFLNRACGAAASALASCELRLALKCEIPSPGKEKKGTIINTIRPVFIDSLI